MEHREILIIKTFFFVGTSACACALSASFDALSGGSIGRGIAASIGTIFGKFFCLNKTRNI